MLEILLINAFVALIFIYVGYLIKYKKHYHLIAGLNDYNPDNLDLHKKYNLKLIGNTLGNSSFIYGATILILTLININQFLVHLLAVVAFIINILIFYKGFKINTN